MKDCTRLDVVKANSKKTKININDKEETNHIWNLRKESMTSELWLVEGDSLKISEDTYNCALDVSIVFEKKLQRFINKIEFNSELVGEKQPNKLSEKIISDLNNLALSANSLAKKLAENIHEMQENTSDQKIDIPVEFSND